MSLPQKSKARIMCRLKLSRADVAKIVGKTASSTAWLRRQHADKYARLAQQHGLRARSAYKLMDIDDDMRILKPGMRVIDLGAAPGGWTLVAADRVRAARSTKPPPPHNEAALEALLKQQYAVTGGQPQRSLIPRRLPPRGTVVAVDLQDIEDIPNATIIKGDFLEDNTQRIVRYYLDGSEADVVLSDMAPRTSGNSVLDHLRIMTLAHAALSFAENVLRPGGAFLCKVFQGAEEEILESRLEQNFVTVKRMKPDSSRDRSAEMFLLAQGFVPNYLHSDYSEKDPVHKEEMLQRFADVRQAAADEDSLLAELRESKNDSK
jgi:23S rRNA (uridine2552-2'-O)-methyltransferase